MAYFTEDFILFFQELAANNYKEWFHENKKRYQREVKDPFEVFTNDLIAEVRPYFESLEVTAKQCIFRINKDIRFSKDKSPYKLHYSGAIAPGGRKDFNTPGIYIEFGPEFAKIYGGLYKLDKDELTAVRRAIVENNDEFQSIVTAPDFVQYFEELTGDKNKRLPKEFKEAAETEPYLFNKSFYYFHKVPADLILREDLLDYVVAAFRAGLPMKEFLTQAVNSVVREEV